MHINLILCLLLLISAYDASAGSIFIYVSQGKSCSKATDPEISILEKNPEDMILSLKAYFNAEIASTTEAAAIVNAGLKFCDDESRRKVFEFLLNKLNTENVNKNVIEVTRNYRQSKVMKELVRDLKANSKSPWLLKHINQIESK